MTKRKYHSGLAVLGTFVIGVISIMFFVALIEGYTNLGIRIGIWFGEISFLATIIYLLYKHYGIIK